MYVLIILAGVGVHVQDNLILAADDSGMVTLTSISDERQVDDIYPMLIQPTAIDVDWLHNLAYVVDGYRVIVAFSFFAQNFLKVAFSLSFCLMHFYAFCMLKQYENNFEFH